ncbi:putative membrane protein [Brucella thiophenivorans]|uniref:Putative membrane protein n=2 Tax=Brucella TaxID=234 RepID=A0A256FL93_9HYPH|nr:putative membrane protein [Brucella rhizosphaerae]OYR18929.1 putative membrane protein [Brucella thiophenivorans]
MNDRLSPRETILIIIIAVLAETPVAAFLVYIIWFAGER